MLDNKSKQFLHHQDQQIYKSLQQVGEEKTISLLSKDYHYRADKLLCEFIFEHVL